MKYLFIGGSKDGERLVVHEGDRCEFKILEGISIDSSNLEAAKSGQPVATEPVFRNESYERMNWGCSHHENSVTKFTFFVLSGISSAEAMEMLIKGYSYYYNPSANGT